MDHVKYPSRLLTACDSRNQLYGKKRLLAFRVVREQSTSVLTCFISWIQDRHKTSDRYLFLIRDSLELVEVDNIAKCEGDEL